jgi:DUF917 family protein
MRNLILTLLFTSAVLMGCGGGGDLAVATPLAAELPRHQSETEDVRP